LGYFGGGKHLFKNSFPQLNRNVIKIAEVFYDVEPFVKASLQLVDVFVKLRHLQIAF
jgi:hypothetical protein